MLRIGGNTSAYSVWTTEGAPGSSDKVYGPDTGRMAAPRRPVGPAAIRNLREFLDAPGWRLIYGLNMGGEGPEITAEEADCVMRTIGPKLVAFQLCNEPDLFSRNGVRAAGYDYAMFAGEWQRYYTAVRKRVPGAPFAGPDTATTRARSRPGRERPAARAVRFQWQNWMNLSPITSRTGCYSPTGWKKSSPPSSTAARSALSAAACTSANSTSGPPRPTRGSSGCTMPSKTA